MSLAASTWRLQAQVDNAKHWSHSSSFTFHGAIFNFIFALRVLRCNDSACTDTTASALPDTSYRPRPSVLGWPPPLLKSYTHPLPYTHPKHTKALKVKSSMALSCVLRFFDCRPPAGLDFIRAATNAAFEFNRVTSSTKRLRAWPRQTRRPHTLQATNNVSETYPISKDIKNTSMKSSRSQFMSLTPLAWPSFSASFASTNRTCPTFDAAASNAVHWAGEHRKSPRIAKPWRSGIYFCNTAFFGLRNMLLPIHNNDTQLVQATLSLTHVAPTNPTRPSAVHAIPLPCHCRSSMVHVPHTLHCLLPNCTNGCKNFKTAARLSNFTAVCKSMKKLFTWTAFTSGSGCSSCRQTFPKKNS